MTFLENLRCLYAVSGLALGAAGLYYYPRQIRRDIQRGKLNEGEAQIRMRKVRMLSYCAILFGVYFTVRKFI